MNYEHVQVRVRVTLSRLNKEALNDDLQVTEAGKTLGILEILKIPKHDGERDSKRDFRHWEAQLRKIVNRIEQELIFDGFPDLVDFKETK